MSLIKLNWTDFENSLIDITESIKYNDGDALKDEQQPNTTKSKAFNLKSVDIFLLGCTGMFTKKSKILSEGSDDQSSEPDIITADGKIGSMLAQMSFPVDEYCTHPSFVTGMATLLAKIAYGNIVEMNNAGPSSYNSTVTGYATQAGIIIEEGINRFEEILAGGLIAAGVMDAVSSLNSVDTDTLPPNFSSAQSVCNKLDSVMTASKEAIYSNKCTNKLSMLVEALAVDKNKEAFSALKLQRVLNAYTAINKKDAEFIDEETFRKLAQTEEEVLAALDLAVELSAKGTEGFKVFNKIASMITSKTLNEDTIITITTRIKVLLLEMATSLSAQGKIDTLEQRIKEIVLPLFKWTDSIIKCDNDKNEGDDKNKDKSEEDFIASALKLCIRAIERKSELIINKFMVSADLVWNKIGKELGESRSWGVLEKVAELYTASCLQNRDVEEMTQKTVQFLIEGMDKSFLCDKDAFRISAEDLFTLSSVCVQRRMDIMSYVHFLGSVNESFAPILDWNKVDGNGVLTGRFMSKVIHGGVKQALCGENFFKAILLNWLSVIRVVSGTKDVKGRIALMEMFARVGECVLSDASRTEIFMNHAVPLAIRVHDGDASLLAIEETLTKIVTSVDKGLRTFNVMKLLCSFDTLLKIATEISDEAQEGVRELFRGLIVRGRREDIKLAMDVTINIAELRNPRYRSLLEGIMGSQKGLPIPAKLHMNLFRILSAAIVICTPDFEAGNEKEEEEGQEEQSKKDTEWAVQAVEHVLKSLATLLNGENPSCGGVTKESIAETLTGLRKISLFKALFKNDVVEISAGGNEIEPVSGAEIMARINNRFPKEILENSQAMEDLMMLGARAVQVRKVRPRFIPVLDDLSCALKVFMEGGDGIPLGERFRKMHKFLLEQPGNVETVARLSKCGYDPIIWEYDDDKEISMTVEVDLRKNIEYGHKSSLESLYGEYVDILLHIGVESVPVPDQEVPVATKLLFSEAQYLALDVIRARKDAAIRAIEEKLGFKCNEEIDTLEQRENAKFSEDFEILCFYANRVRTLLRREDLIDEQYRNERAHAEKGRGGEEKKTFIATLHRSLFHCARSCGSNITGCYAPDGVHAERPIEDGLKAQWGIISLYEGRNKGSTTKTEIENVEIFFSDQGGYIFKSYTNGHSYDTSMVWIVFFHALLSRGLLPAIIVPNNYPTRPTYITLAEHIQPQLVSAELTFKDPSLDGKLERYTPFYDTITTFPPDKICSGDLVLTRDNMDNILLKLNFIDKSKMSTFLSSPTEINSPSSSSSSSSSAKKLRRDLAGTITTEVIESLNKSHPGNTNLVNAVGRPLAAFIANHIQGKDMCDTTDIKKVIWSDKGKKRGAKKKKAKGTPESEGSAEVLSEENKNDMLKEIVDTVHSKLNKVYSETPEDILTKEGTQRFFEVLAHLRTLVDTDDNTRCPQLLSTADALTLVNAYEDTIRSKIKYQNIGELKEDERHELMSWIYHNEQKEWITRGGRNRQEMLEDFVVLGAEGRQFPGVVATYESLSNSSGGSEDNSKIILGYCIGEFVDSETYEVTCAWVSSRARCLRIASTLYLLVLEYIESTGKVPGAKVCKKLICDVILGATNRMGFSDLFCRFTMVERKNSWSTGTDTGVTEQFERLVFDFAKVKTCYKLFITSKRICSSNVVRTIVKYKKPILIGAGVVGAGLALSYALRCFKKN